MLKTIRFMSLADYKAFPTNQKTAIISIGAPGEELPKEKLCFSFLRVEFDDLTAEWVGVPESAVPEKTKDGSHLEWHGYILPMADHAEKIVEFVDNAHHAKDELDLIIHCHAGISRSAAVANFVSKMYSVPLFNANCNIDGANTRLHRLLNKAYEASRGVENGFVIADTAPDMDELQTKFKSK